MIVDLIITLNADFIKNMTSLITRFQKEGLSVSSSTKYGIIMGKADNSLIPKLAKEKEVESVMQDFYTQIPPPNSDVQ